MTKNKTIGFTTSREKENKEKIVIADSDPDKFSKQLKDARQLRGSGSQRGEIDADLLDELVEGTDTIGRIRGLIDNIFRPSPDEIEQLGFPGEKKKK